MNNIVFFRLITATVVLFIFSITGQCLADEIGAKKSGCENCGKHNKSRNSKTICIAHRGGAAYAPENTLAAIKNAVKIGADYAEIDVHLSKDGEIVVIHDDELERTTNGKGQVKDKTLKELKRLDAGSWFSPKFKGERIPTLEEVLDTAKGKIGIVIEIKNGPNFYEGIEEKVVKLVRKKDMVDDVIVISFDHSCLKKVHKLDPGIKTGALYYANILDMKNLSKTTGAKYMCPGWHLVTADSIKEAHKNGLKVNIWTVNDAATMRKFIKMGVDCISTDKPDILLNEFPVIASVSEAIPYTEDGMRRTENRWRIRNPLSAIRYPSEIASSRPRKRAPALQ